MSSAGKSPPRRAAIRVRSAGGMRSAAATGPAPFPSAPWQAAQCVANAWPPTSTSIGFGSPGAGGGDEGDAVEQPSSTTSRTQAKRDTLTPSLLLSGHVGPLDRELDALAGRERGVQIGRA